MDKYAPTDAIVVVNDPLRGRGYRAVWANNKDTACRRQAFGPEYAIFDQDILARRVEPCANPNDGTVTILTVRG